MRQTVIIMSACWTSWDKSNCVALHTLRCFPIPRGALRRRPAFRPWIIRCRNKYGLDTAPLHRQAHARCRSFRLRRRAFGLGRWQRALLRSNVH